MWYVIVFFLGVSIGIWLHMAYLSWKQSRIGLLKHKAKRENRTLRRK